MFENKECANGTKQGCPLEPGLATLFDEKNEWLEETVWYGMRMWHCIFLSIGAVLSFTILLCCCFKFRIPRTKQEIEGDYIRRRIMRKFRKRLKAIQNQELDEMDLKKALDKIRTELKSDTESLQQSDVLSGATFSSAGGGINPTAGSTYRRASQIQIDISLEDLRIQSMGLGARIAVAFGRFFGRPKKAPSEKDDEEAGNVVGEEPTTALLPPKKTGGGLITTTATSGGVGDANKRKKDKVGDEQKGAEKGKEPTKKAVGKEADDKMNKLEATTSKEKPKEKEKDKKKKSESSKELATLKTPTTIVTTEKETGNGKGEKKEDKKNKKDKGKKSEKGKTEPEAAPPPTTAATVAKKDSKVETKEEKGTKVGATADKKNNSKK